MCGKHSPNQIRQIRYITEWIKLKNNNIKKRIEVFPEYSIGNWISEHLK